MIITPILMVNNLIYSNCTTKYIRSITQADNVISQTIYTLNLSLSQLQKAVQDTIQWLANRRINGVFNQYGYYNFSEVAYLASQTNNPSSTEAQQLLNWYNIYDNMIWTFIESIPSYTNIDELYSMNLRDYESYIYIDSSTALPPLT